MEAKFKIGDHVKVIPSVNGSGEVIDVLHSSKYGCEMYEVSNPDDLTVYGVYPPDDLELIPEKKEYSMEIKIDIAENVVIATLYEMTADTKGVVAKGHGHLIHEGDIGIAQAASYACMRLYKSFGGFQNA